MYKILIIIFLFGFNSFSQTVIGKTEGANIVLEDSRYMVTFQSNDGKYVSFYMPRSKNVDEDGLFALKKYVYLLFDKKGDYLLQFEEDSIFLVYENNQVQMIIWRNHDSDNRTRSKGYTLLQFQELFGDSKFVHKKL